MLCFSKLCICVRVCVCIRACVQVICRLLPIRQIAGSRWPCGRSCCFSQRPPVSVSPRTFLFGAARHCALLRSALSTLNHSAQTSWPTAAKAAHYNAVDKSTSASSHLVRAERVASPGHAGGPSHPPWPHPPRLFLVQHNILYHGRGGRNASMCVCMHI